MRKKVNQSVFNLKMISPLLKKDIMLGTVDFFQDIYHSVLVLSTSPASHSIFAVCRFSFGNKILNSSRWIYFGTAVTWLVSKEGSSQTLKDCLLLPAVRLKLQWAVLESFQSLHSTRW